MEGRGLEEGRARSDQCRAQGAIEAVGVERCWWWGTSVGGRGARGQRRRAQERCEVLYPVAGPVSS